MKKRLTILVTVLLFALCLHVVPVAADTYSGNPLFVDGAKTCSDEQVYELHTKLEGISNEHKCEVVIYTTTLMGDKTATQFADDFFDEYNYGYGEGQDGILFMIDLEQREWAISTEGFGITAFTDAGQEYMMEQILELLGDDEWYEAFHLYADLCDLFLTQARTGEPYDVDNLPQEPKSFNLIMDVIIGLAIGFVISLIIVSVDKAELKTVRHQAMAKDYVRQGSFHLTAQWDQFLYRHVDRFEKEKDEGGSNIHVSSSGDTHGGSSGSF